MDEQEKAEFVELCTHVMAKFQSVLDRVDHDSQVLDVIGMSDSERKVIQAFMGSTMQNVKGGADDVLTAMLSAFTMGVLFGQEGRAHIGDLQ